MCLFTVTATTGFNIQIKYAIQILAAFIHPGKPMYVTIYLCLCSELMLCYLSANMYVNLYGNSTAYQTLYMLQGRSPVYLCHFSSTKRLHRRFEVGSIHETSSPCNFRGTDGRLYPWFHFQLHQYVQLLNLAFYLTLMFILYSDDIDRYQQPWSSFGPCWYSCGRLLCLDAWVCIF